MSQKPSLVVLDGATLNPGDNPWDEVAALGQFTLHDRTPAELTVERAKGARIVVTNKTRLTADVLGQLDSCRFIAVLATGYDVVDVAEAGKRGIPVSNVPGYGSESVAQFVMAQLLAMARRVESHDRLVREGEWNRRGEFTFWDTPQVELAGKTMGVVGFGGIGRRVAELALAFGMRVAAYAPRAKEPLPNPDFAFVGSEELFREADVVSLHCPLTAGNDGFVNAGLLKLMKPGSYLINTARGRLVNEKDLASALNSGHLAGAALDVLAVEPPDSANPLLSAKNCLITPHMAWASLTARKRLMSITASKYPGVSGRPVPKCGQCGFPDRNGLRFMPEKTFRALGDMSEAWGETLLWAVRQIRLAMLAAKSRFEAYRERPEHDIAGVDDPGAVIEQSDLHLDLARREWGVPTPLPRFRQKPAPREIPPGPYPQEVTPAPLP